MIIILGGAIFPTVSNAVGNTKTLYATHRYGNLLERNGVDLTCIYIVHNENGVEYPAYCLNLELDGATEDFSYTVNADTQLTNMEIWRTVVNGYPYKTPEELGCKTKEEAYLATRQAVYCAVYGRDPNSYSSLGGEAGERTLNALKQIVQTARTSNTTKLNSTINIKEEETMWRVDKLDTNYVSKEFTTTASAGIKNYNINLSGDLIEGIKVTDTNNTEKSEFAGNEKFKILIPIKNIEQDGNFAINVKGEVATKPVLYGLSENPNLQNVAVTGNIYEYGIGTNTQYYFKNETKVVIVKQDQETKHTLEGVKFQLLDENKKVIYADLTTNEQGIVVIENLLPGKYYVQEVSTLENYEVYDKYIEIELKLNEETKVTVNNLKNEELPSVEKINTELEVEQIKTNQEIKLPKTGM